LLNLRIAPEQSPSIDRWVACGKFAESGRTGSETGSVGVSGVLAVSATPRSRSFPNEIAKGIMVSRIFASWNQLDGWLRQIDQLRYVA
jgi:hypothetical protein